MADDYLDIHPTDGRPMTAGSISANEWRQPELYFWENDMVQVLCEVTSPKPVKPKFPRACELPVSIGDHAVGDRFVSVGCRLECPEDPNQPWTVAGWNMAQDCWEDARCFKVIAWQPLAKPSS